MSPKIDATISQTAAQANKTMTGNRHDASISPGPAAAGAEGTGKGSLGAEELALMRSLDAFSTCIGTANRLRSVTVVADPARSAWESSSVLRLVLRTQPRSGSEVASTRILARIGTLNPIGQIRVAYATRICPGVSGGSWRDLDCCLLAAR